MYFLSKSVSNRIFCISLSLNFRGSRGLLLKKIFNSLSMIILLVFSLGTLGHLKFQLRQKKNLIIPPAFMPRGI